MDSLHAAHGLHHIGDAVAGEHQQGVIGTQAGIADDGDGPVLGNLVPACLDSFQGQCVPVGMFGLFGFAGLLGPGVDEVEVVVLAVMPQPEEFLGRDGTDTAGEHVLGDVADGVDHVHGRGERRGVADFEVGDILDLDEGLVLQNGGHGVHPGLDRFGILAAALHTEHAAVLFVDDELELHHLFLVADFDGTSAGKILFESEGLSGYSAESLRAWQRTAGSAADSSGTAGLCLCDQGGERIDILKERTATLRAEAHHPPCILENHPADSRLQISENGKVQTLTSRCGTGGGNVPLLMDTPKTLKIRCGKAGGGKGSLIQENKSATLSCNNDQTVFQPKAYGISSFSSNAMLSGNPHSGIYEADTARTLDTSDQSPAKNQGGIAVVESYALQGSMIGRSDQNGPQGGGVNKEVAFTLNATDHHAVYAASTGNFSSAFRETTPTLLARDHKDPSIVSSGYAVRRLTPQECARLQGFPDQWCSDLASENPTEEEIDRWAAIFEEYRKAVKPESRPKSRKMVQKWLQDPYRDAAEYRLWGNGICLNVAVFVLAGIVWADL